MNKKQILQVSLAGIIGFVIYVAVSILSGEIERWKKLIIFSVTYAILLPLVRYIKKYRKRSLLQQRRTKVCRPGGTRKDCAAK